MKFKTSRKSERRENARLQEHVLKRVLNTYVTTGAARTALEKAVKEKGDARAQYEAVRDAHKRTGERLNRQQIDTELNAYKWHENEVNFDKFERGLRNIAQSTSYTSKQWNSRTSSGRTYLDDALPPEGRRSKCTCNMVVLGNANSVLFAK